MKWLNFVEEPYKYTRGFIVVYIEENELFIGHTVNENRTEIRYKDLNEWIEYFDRI